MNASYQDIDFNKVIGQKYKIVEKIGEGNFGIVFKGINIRNNELVAIKVENNDKKSKVLNNEAKVLKHLSGLDCVPKFNWFGAFDNHRFIVMQLLGKSLLDYKDIKNTLSLNVCLQVFEKIVYIFKSIHDKGIIYRDIKPENFLFDLNNLNKIYIIDFGLATSYIDGNNKHIEEDKKGHYTGTIRYSSINIHEGYNHSRRDDLISLGYMIMYLLLGDLPWMGVNDDNIKSKFNTIMKIKKSNLNNNIFSEYFKICYCLGFKENPNYNKLIETIKNIHKDT